MKCLVSGATGFIGRHLCPQLAARGYEVTPLSRRGEPLPGGMDTRKVDLAMGSVPRLMLEEVDVVFHLAAVAHQQAPAERYHRVNYEAVLCLAKEAEAAGVGCFIFLSSVKAMGPAKGAEPRTETDCAPAPEPYGESKWLAEQGLRREFLDSPMSVVILRPALVYGDKPLGNLRYLARWVRRGLPRPPADGGRAMVAIEDLVTLMCQLAEQQPRGINTWIVCDGHSYSTRQVYDLLRHASGKGDGIGWLPRWGWRLGAWLIDKTVARGPEDTWERLFGMANFSNRAVIEATGWRPTRSLADAAGRIARSAEVGA